jgi:hypothetical protein
MTLARFSAWTLLVAAGFALAGPPASGRQEPPAPPLPRKNSSVTEKVTTYRDAQRSNIKDEQKEAKVAFAAFAKYYADVVAHPSVYKAPQEFKLDTPGVRVPTIDGSEGILVDLDRFLMVPQPGGKAGREQADYITELGLALDNALKPHIETHPDTIVRVNAARVLAHACKSGAPAHFPTVTALLSNANTRTEIKYHLFHAAANLLAAHDPDELNTRVHVHQLKNPKMVGELVKVLQDCVGNPELLVTDLPKGKVEAATPEQLAVIGLVRRQAVRALAKVRFVSVPGPDGKTPLYPAYTLARVALADPALVPAPGPAEAAEAAIGLCTMAPVTVGMSPRRPVKEYNTEVAVEAVTAALITFASPRAANAADRTLPWRSYALRTAEALHNWRPLFDPDFDPTRPTKYNPELVPPLVNELYKEVLPNVLAPMDKVDVTGKPDVTATVRIEELRKRLAELRANPKRKTTLFEGHQETTIDFARKK